MRRRIKKKKGLLKDPEYEKLRQHLREELEQQMRKLEQIADKKVGKMPDFLSEKDC